MMKNQLLIIDLSSRSYRTELISDNVLRQYLGGRGLGAYLMYKLMSPKLDPLGAENHLIFTAGPSNGTGFYFSSKSVVTTKSPLTGIYLYSIASGTFSHQMRKAGYWAVAIRGIADLPVYLNIKNQAVEFKDARNLWGMEASRAQEAMLGGLSRRGAATVAIGSAGEELLKCAAIFSEGSLNRSFGRGGAGCIMELKS